jgi:hypothetical protein
MQLTIQQVREMAGAMSLDIPEADVENVRLRLSALLSAMEEIERELGAEMDRTEPIPPVYPHEEF